MSNETFTTSFTSRPIVRTQLDVLRVHYGENTSQIITRLISEAYTRVMVEIERDERTPR